ncbi:MAG: histidine phosphatase family protein [Propionibacteriaceae bacterium]|nr:histidine phosphatase family protein [Propionibacteriaceae bacterium]
MTAGRVLLLRHGTTDWNNAGRFQGHADVPLNAEGLALAERTAVALAGYRPTSLVSSDLSRAWETAQAVATVTGLDVAVDPRLREVDVGSWAGLDMETAGRLEPDFWPALREGRDFRRSPEGETATEAGERVAAVLREYTAAAADGDVVLAVGHGLSLRVGALLLMGLDYSHARLFGGLANCGWIDVEPAEPHWRLRAYNRVAG